MNQGAVTCTDLGLKHAYSFEATGTDLGTGQVAAAGTVTLNGTGGITGSATLSLGGTIYPSVALKEVTRSTPTVPAPRASRSASFPLRTGTW